MYAALWGAGCAFAAARSKLPKRGRRRITEKPKITTRSVLLLGGAGTDYDGKKMGFSIGLCQAAKLEIERFATPFNFDCLYSVGQEQRWLRNVHFHWELHRGQNRKTRFSDFPTAMVLEGGNARKFVSFWGRGDSFLRVFPWCK